MKQSMKPQIRKTVAGALAALFIYLLLLALTAFLMVRGTIDEKSIGLLAPVFSLASAFLGTKTAVAGEGKAFLPALCCAALFWCVVLLGGFWANDTLNPMRAAVLAGAVLAGALCACSLHGKKKNGAKRKRRGRK